MKKSVKKNKFVDTNYYNFNKQPFYEIDKNENLQINLIKDNYNDKEKIQITLKDNFDPHNYNLNYYDSIKRTFTEENNYLQLLNQEPGRGFGNLNINNEIRTGDEGRIDTHEFKNYRESEVNNRFDFIDNRFINPQNLVLPFPRSGIHTRKVINFNSQLDIDANFNDNIDFNDNFDFNDNNDNNDANFNDNLTYGFMSNPSEFPNNNIINNINQHNLNEKQQQIDYMNKIKSLKEDIYDKSIQYQKKLVAESSTPYKFNNTIPDDLQLFNHISTNYLPNNSSLQPSSNYISNNSSSQPSSNYISNNSLSQPSSNYISNNSSLQSSSNYLPNNSSLQPSSNYLLNNSSLQSSSNYLLNNSSLQPSSNYLPNNSSLQQNNNYLSNSSQQNNNYLSNSSQPLNNSSSHQNNNNTPNNNTPNNNTPHNNIPTNNYIQNNKNNNIQNNKNNNILHNKNNNILHNNIPTNNYVPTNNHLPNNSLFKYS